MARLNKDDLVQMNKDYFQSLEKQRLVEVAINLHQLAIEQWERLEQNSHNSSRPPSSDNPYQKPDKDKQDVPPTSSSKEEQDIKSPQEENLSSPELSSLENQKLGLKSGEQPRSEEEKRKPGKQPGAEGKWRTQALIAEEIVPHYPEQCASCNKELEKRENKPYMGYYVLELQPQKSGFEVVCQLHHYHELKCECGHQTKARPGVGYLSCVEGRSVDLKLTEYVLVGPMLATLIASTPNWK